MLKRLRLMGPVLFRLILLCCISLAIAGLVSPLWGVVILVAGLLLEIFMDLNYIVLLAQWLEDPEAQSPSVSSGLWSEIFYRVARSRKALQTNTRRLQDREARYRKTLAALPEGIVVVKSDWAVSWCNETAKRIFGIHNENDFGLTEQERLDAMRRDFVANVSHELRTPLTVLMGFLDMALHGLTDDSNKKVELQTAHLSLMREQAGRMQRLINDLLTLSRLETGSSDKKSEIFSLSDLVSTITEEIRVMAINTHQVTSAVTPAIWINGYPDEIRSAIVNLMTNAVRYTPAGGQIHAHLAVRDDGMIVISVVDNGIGIAPKDIPRLTERFYRVDKSRSRDTGGTGLGLAIVKHALLHHNARLKIESSLGKGSTFTITLPAAIRANDPEAAEAVAGKAAD